MHRAAWTATGAAGAAAVRAAGRRRMATATASAAASATTTTMAALKSGDGPGDGLGVATVFETDCVRLYEPEEVESTMDSMKQLLGMQEQPNQQRTLAVAAVRQRKGRGTRGRRWMSEEGNLHLTVAIPAELAISMTLLSLRVGTLLVQQIRELLIEVEAETGCSSLSSSTQATATTADTESEEGSALEAASAADATESDSATEGEGKDELHCIRHLGLKWPNDLLVDECKLGGVLIEGTGSHFLIGIGINVVCAPQVPRTGEDAGREATCLANHVSFDLESTNFASRLSRGISHCIGAWHASGTDTDDAVLHDWSKLVNWNVQHILRDESVRVQPVAINRDGTLTVRTLPESETRILAADYLW